MPAAQDSPEEDKTPVMKPAAVPAPRRVPRHHRLRAEKFARYSLLILVIATGIVFFTMVRIFIVPVILAAVFAGMFYPLFNWVVKITRGQRAISALFCCALLSLGLLLPAYGVANMVATEAVHLYKTAGPAVSEALKADSLERLQQHAVMRWLRFNNLPVQAWLEQVTRNATELLVAIVNRVSRGTFELVAQVLIAFFTMFYFFRDGPKLIDRLKYFSPLAEHYEDELIRRFRSVSRATIKGTLLVSLIKGLLGGLTFWLFGVEAAALWGGVMGFLSVLPVVGPWIVMYPAGLVLILSGDAWGGVAILLIATFVISSIDNVLE